jgi:hypothetical protein
VKGGETTTTPVQSWHRGREVERLLGSRPRTCPFCFFFFYLGKSRFSVFGFLGEEQRCRGRKTFFPNICTLGKKKIYSAFQNDTVFFFLTLDETTQFCLKRRNFI